MTDEQDLRIWILNPGSSVLPLFCFRTGIEQSFLVILGTGNVLANTFENK